MGFSMTKNRWMLWACGLTAFAVLLLLALFGQDIGSFIDSKSSRPLAIYKDYEIYGWDASSFNKILIGSSLDIASFYVELPDNRRILLRELPIEVADQISNDHYSRPVNIVVYFNGYVRQTILSYRDGKLNFAALTDSCPFRISPHKDGPYVKLPISRETLLKVFGPPLRWEKAPRPPSGP